MLSTQWPMNSSETEFFLVMVTTPDHSMARKLAKIILQAEKAACINIVGNIESHYRWKGNLECEQESLMLIKTQGSCIQELQDLILKNHPYETPEFIAVPIQEGSKNYLDWIRNNVL